MAILATEGFDWQAAATDFARSGYTITNSSSAMTFATGAYGKGQALLMGVAGGSQGRISLPILGAPTRVFVSLSMSALYSAADISADGSITLVENGPTYHITFLPALDGRMRLYRGSTLLATSTNVIFTDLTTFRHIEIDATIHDSSGSVTLKADGVTEISFSGDTRNGGTSGVVHAVSFRGTNPSSVGIPRIGVDNIVIQDATGSAPYNAPLGPVIVDGRLRPTSDVSVQGAPSSGSDNYAMVDEAYLSMSDYVAFDAAEADRYGIGNLDVTPASVYQVKVIALVDADSGGQEAQIEAHVGGNTTTGSTTIVPSTGSISLTMTSKPGGGDWTPTDVNGLEVTFERTA